MEDDLFQVPFVRAKFKYTYGDLEALSELSMCIDRKIIVSGESYLSAAGPGAPKTITTVWSASVCVQCYVSLVSLN